MELAPIDLINLGTHATLIVVIFWLLKLISDLIRALRENTVTIAELRAAFEDEIAASGGFRSREN